MFSLQTVISLLLLLVLLVNSCFSENLNNRLDCWLENGYQIDEQSCLARGCIWDRTPRPQGVPICYLDTGKVGYKVVGPVRKSDSGLEADLALKSTATKTLQSPSIESLKFQARYLTDRIIRFTLRDAKNPHRYEVPIQSTFNLLDSLETDEQKRQYLLNVSSNLNDFQFTIQRKDNQNNVFDTSIGGLVYSDQFIQLATRLATRTVYGFGENVHQTLQHDLNYRTWPMFARDVPPGDNEHNLYGVHPFYTVLERDGRAHGVLFINSNAMDYTLLPEPALSLKSSGGILDFLVFVGDNPEHVIQLYTSVIGRTTMPPLWGLGFQLCRYGFKDTNNVKQMIDRNIKEQIPLDVMYIDIDYMSNYEDFTYNSDGAFKGLPELMKQTRNTSQLHWTLILDPAIEANNPKYQAFSEGYKQDVYIKWDPQIPVKDRHYPPDVPTDKGVLYGKVWPRGPAAFPDFMRNQTDKWWQQEIQKFHTTVPFDALWIDMNEPSNFPDGYKICPHTKYDYPPFRTKALWGGGDVLSQQTVCMTSRQGENSEYMHYDVHNLYGITESISTKKGLYAATGKRSFAVSRSTYPSSGRYVAHWLGDNYANWSHLRKSIIGMLEFNLFGINFVGADICGFQGQTTPDLCRRWHQLGAFYPFSRNHNDLSVQSDQDPAAWKDMGHPEVTDTARAALQLRYQLLPHLYTLFYESHTTGSTVARPMHHVWPLDATTHTIDQQFMWGSSVLISPFVFENQKEVKAYLPAADVWYEVRPEIKRVENVGYITIPDTPASPPPVHLRGGHVISMVSTDKLVTTQSDSFKHLQLVVLPDGKTGGSQSSYGQLFWDDGDSIDTIERNAYNLYSIRLTGANCTVSIVADKHGLDKSVVKPTIDRLVVAGTRQMPGQLVATVDGKQVQAKHVNGRTEIDVNQLLDTTSTNQWTVQWKDSQSGKCDLL